MEKSCLILPKAIREAVGMEEGDEVYVEVGDGIILRPDRSKVDPEKLRRAFERHVESLRRVQGRREPRPGELAGEYLEEEFDESFH